MVAPAPSRPRGTASALGGAVRGQKRALEGVVGAPAQGYAVGTRVVVHANFDGSAHPADVIEQRTGDAGVSYYVHYVDYDKRLDEWVDEDRVLGLADAAQNALVSMPSLGVGDDQKMTRRLKRKIDEIHHVSQDIHDLAPLDQQMEEEHQERTRVKNIQSVELGKYEIFTWYYSPYPEPYAALEKLFVCEFCLKYFRKKTTFVRHAAKCELTHPPGDEIYRSPPRRPGQAPDPAAGIADPTIAVFEVDGARHKVYCQSLCLLSKLFLDHKTLYYDVDPFLFYILCEEIGGVYHIVGYFSKEKHSVDHNLACILVFPPYQKKGYGGFIMQFSYELSKKEGRRGTPERPLSDLGQVAYRAFWSRVLLPILQRSPQLSIKDLADATAFKESDITETLSALGCIRYYKGSHLLAPQGRVIEEALAELGKKRFIGVDVSRLHWTPFAPVQAAPPPPGAGH